MKALTLALALTVVPAALAGCGGSLQASPVEYVWTRTPGVVFVIVHPDQQPGKQYPSNTDASGKAVDARAEYLMVCDARKSDGMHCEVATEQAIRRYSFAPNTAGTAPAIEEPVGSIPESAELIEREPRGAAEASPPPPPAPAPPPPPPPPLQLPSSPGGKK